MDIFDKIGQRISVIGQSVSKMYSDKTGKADVVSLIKNEEQHLEELYAKIGRLYMELYDADPNENFYELSESVKSSKQRIRNFEEQMSMDSEWICCSECGGKMIKGQSFCVECGTKLLTSDVESKLKCRFCGGFVNKNMHFCTECGKKMED